MLRALPTSSWTGFGKSRRSRFEDPAQCSGFSPEAGTRRTAIISHFWDAHARVTGEQEGNTRGEQGLARGVPPLVHLAQHESRVDGSASRHALLRANSNERCELLNTRIGRRSMPINQRDGAGEAVNRNRIDGQPGGDARRDGTKQRSPETGDLSLQYRWLRGPLPAEFGVLLTAA